MDQQALWRPGAERIATARMTAFRGAVNTLERHVLGLQQSLALVSGAA